MRYVYPFFSSNVSPLITLPIEKTRNDMFLTDIARLGNRSSAYSMNDSCRTFIVPGTFCHIRLSKRQSKNKIVQKDNCPNRCFIYGGKTSQVYDAEQTDFTHAEKSFWNSIKSN